MFGWYARHRSNLGGVKTPMVPQYIDGIEAVVRVYWDPRVGVDKA